MPEILGVPLTGLTAPAMLSVVFLLFITGKIWTNAAYQEKVAEAERWRLAYEAEREARSTSDSQTRELLEVARTTQALITGVYSNSERIRQSGET